MKARILTLIPLFAAAAVLFAQVPDSGSVGGVGAPPSGQPPRPDRWTVLRDNMETGSAPVSRVGDVDLVDALSLADALGLHYFRDTEDRYVFSFPANPVIFVPGGSFAQVGLEIVHFPVPPYQDGFRFFIPEQQLLDILGVYLAGEVSEDSSARVLSYNPPDHPLLSVDGADAGQEWVWRFVFDRPLTGKIELADTATVVLHMEGVTPDSAGEITVGGDDLFGAEVLGDPSRDAWVVITPRAVRNARLEGPDAGNVLTLVVAMATPDEEPAAPQAYNHVSVDEALREARAKWKIDTIVIDAGHGGQDPGAIGRSKRTREKDMALDIAILLRDEVKKRSDIKVVMTRDKDVFVPLGQRTKIANKAGGKLFISIHCNSSTNRMANGQYTYFLSPVRTERAMEVSLKENSVIKYEERRQDYPDLSEENFILLAMAQAQFVKESEELASMILRSMSSKTGLRNRGVDQAGFYVLIGASMPAVLVETAFISNPKEEDLLHSKSFRKKVATGICDAILEFRKRYGE
ncbi:MAG: N-acetylmuramoyl-L-alanine amidase [bacterium]